MKTVTDGPSGASAGPADGPSGVPGNSRKCLKVGGTGAEDMGMMSHEIFEYESRRAPRRSLRIAPFVVLIALAAYATVVVAALTGPSSAQSGFPAQNHVQVVESSR